MQSQCRLNGAAQACAQSKEHSNRTRVRRGAVWDENNPCYDLVTRHSTHQEDVRCYPSHKAYIWIEKHGVPEVYLKVAAGGSNLNGDFKILLEQ